MAGELDGIVQAARSVSLAPIRVLIVDDDEDVCILLRTGLLAPGFRIDTVATAREALARVDAGSIDVVVADIQLPAMTGLELCRRLAVQRVPVVVMTAYGSFEAAVEAIRAGAHDFITKPLHLEEVRRAVGAAAHCEVGPEPWQPPRRPALDGASDILGESLAISALRDLLSRAATSDASVLVTGESGTGKELVARALHRAGARSSGPFVALSCAAIPEALLESELFGHVKGAFTDAKTTKMGMFQQAHGGTLFLDEIGDLPFSLQPKLLRALEERTARPLGGSQEIPFDVRLVAATNEDLAAAVARRRFRNDLYFRINVVHVEVPPLRAREGDVALLAHHFVEMYSTKYAKRVHGLTREALDRLAAYTWPGNVRELRNCIERAVALADRGEIRVEDLPSAVVADVSPSPSLPAEALVSLAEVERLHTLRVLAAVGGNKRMAARVLGLDRRTLYRRLERYLQQKH